MMKKRIPLRKMLTFGILPSWLKVRILRLKGHNVGKGTKIGFGSVIFSDGISIGDRCKIGSFTIISCNKFTIDKDSEIGSFCYIDVPELAIGMKTTLREQVMIGGMTTPESKIIIGNNVKIFQFTYLNPTKPIIIGNGVGIGGRCSIFTHGSWQSILDGYPVSFGGVTIEDDVWLPWQVFVLPGVTIGRGATIGACSMVNRDIPERSLAVGSPAKVIRGPDEYPKQLSFDEKYQIINEIIDEYINWITFRDKAVSIKRTTHEVNIESNVGCGVVFLPKENEEFKAIVSENRKGQLIMLSLLDAQPNNKNVSNIRIYYLHEKTASGPSFDLSNDLELFLSRYGIRFSD